MEIRFAQPQDVPGILSLLRQIGQVHHTLRPDLIRPHAQKYSASQVLAMLNDPASPIFVAAEEGRILGYGICLIENRFRDPVMEDGATLYIDDLCVDEKVRHRHIGTALYESIVRYARARNFHNITLNVLACHREAVSFYESLGMKPQKICMESLLEEI